MEFNAEHWAELVAAARAEVDDGDQSWRADVDMRYGRWIARQALRAADRALADLALLESAPDRRKLLAHVSEQLASTVKLTQTAALLIGGDLRLADPAKFEAIMRVAAAADPLLAS